MPYLFILHDEVLHVTHTPAARDIYEHHAELDTCCCCHFQNAVEVPGFDFMKAEVVLMLVACNCFLHLARALVDPKDL